MSEASIRTLEVFTHFKGCRIVCLLVFLYPRYFLVAVQLCDGDHFLPKVNFQGNYFLGTVEWARVFLSSGGHGWVLSEKDWKDRNFFYPFDHLNYPNAQKGSVPLHPSSLSRTRTVLFRRASSVEVRTSWLTTVDSEKWSANRSEHTQRIRPVSRKLLYELGTKKPKRTPDLLGHSYGGYCLRDCPWQLTTVTQSSFQKSSYIGRIWQFSRAIRHPKE